MRFFNKKLFEKKDVKVMYYIYSLCITLIIFYILQLYDNEEFLKTKDVITLIVIYMITTTLTYILSNQRKNSSISVEDTIHTGFMMK